MLTNLLTKGYFHMKTYESLRKTYPVFLYKDHEIQDRGTELSVTYHFEVPGLSCFSPTWSFPKSTSAALKIHDNPTFQAMIFGLGMVELISYWKIACPPKVIVSAGALDGPQVIWWKELYYLGLGEF